MVPSTALAPTMATVSVLCCVNGLIDSRVFQFIPSTAPVPLPSRVNEPLLEDVWVMTITQYEKIYLYDNKIFTFYWMQQNFLQSVTNIVYIDLYKIPHFYSFNRASISGYISDIKAETSRLAKTAMETNMDGIFRV